MKEVKAFIHRARAAEAVRALIKGGFSNLSLVDVKGMLEAIGTQEREFSTEFGLNVVTEVKLELVCEDDQTPTAIDLIRQHAKTGKDVSGLIFVSDVTEVISF